MVYNTGMPRGRWILPDEEEFSSIEEDPLSVEEEPFARSFLESYRVTDALFAALLNIVIPRSLSLTGNTAEEIKKRGINPEAILESVDEWVTLRPQIEELGSYLGLDFSNKKNFDELLAEYLSWGLNPKQGLQVAGIYTKKKRGAAISARRTAVQALELRLADRHKWTWPRLAQEFCTCPKPKNEHNAYCRENIRQAVMALEKVLKRHGVYPDSR